MGTALVLSACGGGGDEAAPAENNGDGGGGDTATATDGDAAKLYAQKCSSCHGQNLEGGVGPDLTAVGGRLSAEEIAGIIENGQGAMPKGLLSGEEAQQVADWLAAKK